jgi:hypothetical protein
VVQPALDQLGLTNRLLDNREGLGQHRDRFEAIWHLDHPFLVFYDFLGHESVCPGDTALRVVSVEAHIRLTCRTGCAGVRSANSDRDEIAGSKTGDIWSKPGDPTDDLMPEHQFGLPLRREADLAPDQLAIRSTHANANHRDLNLAGSWFRELECREVNGAGKIRRNGNGADCGGGSHR